MFYCFLGSFFPLTKNPKSLRPPLPCHPRGECFLAAPGYSRRLLAAPPCCPAAPPLQTGLSPSSTPPPNAGISTYGSLSRLRWSCVNRPLPLLHPPPNAGIATWEMGGGRRKEEEGGGEVESEWNAGVGRRSRSSNRSLGQRRNSYWNAWVLEDVVDRPIGVSGN